MRIIAGTAKGKKIITPVDDKTRPLKDMVRESIFNIINHSGLSYSRLENSCILDLFSGVGSFGFETAETMLDAGFLPDAISSDVHSLSIKGPAYDQLVTLSKFLHLGMSISDIVAASTTGPARAIRRPELGTLSPGSIGDATILNIEDGEFIFTDSLGHTRTGEKKFALKGIVLDGKIWD